MKLLQQKQIRTGVISNISYSGDALTKRLNRLLPENNFEFIIASSDYIFRKPNKRIFQLALEKADLQAEDVWYIGDQYQCDVVGAKEAGMFPIWYTAAIDFKQDMEQDCMKVSSWKELEYLFDR